MNKIKEAVIKADPRIMRIPHLFASSFILLCLALVTAPLCKSVGNAWIWLIPIGMADAVVLVMLDTILQKVTPDRVRGKVFGLQLTFCTFSFLIGREAERYAPELL